MGDTVQLSGTIMDYRDGQLLPISLTWPQEELIGEVQADGSFQATFRAPPGIHLHSVESLLWAGAPGSTGGPVCPLSTIQAEPAGVPAEGISTLVVPRAAEGSHATPLTTPPIPEFRRLIPAGEASRLTFVWVGMDVRVMGERKCIEVHPNGMKDQFNLHANLVLRAGWNRLSSRQESTLIGDVRIHRSILEARPTLETREWILGH